MNSIVSMVTGVIAAGITGAIAVVVITNVLLAAGLSASTGLWPIIILLIPVMIIMAIVGGLAFLAASRY
jgi:hypothetical protein